VKILNDNYYKHPLAQLTEVPPSPLPDFLQAPSWLANAMEDTVF
jgi:hypothetical protein